MPDAGRDDRATHTAGRPQAAVTFYSNIPSLSLAIIAPFFMIDEPFTSPPFVNLITMPLYHAATQDEARQGLGRAEAAQKKGRAALTKASKEQAQLKQRLRDTEKDRDRALAHAR